MKKYQIILADPPWSYNDQGCQGTMAKHYKLWLIWFGGACFLAGWLFGSFFKKK